MPGAARRRYNAPAHRASAAAWLASDDQVYPYSFVNVCVLLDLDPVAVRRALAARAAA